MKELSIFQTYRPQDWVSSPSNPRHRNYFWLRIFNTKTYLVWELPLIIPVIFTKPKPRGYWLKGEKNQTRKIRQINAHRTRLNTSNGIPNHRFLSYIHHNTPACCPSVERSCQKRQEKPATSDLDWSLAPIPKSKNVLHVSTATTLHRSFLKLHPYLLK